jgi:hypothetical protein
MKTFRKIVDGSLENRNLAVKLLFRMRTARFVAAGPRLSDVAAARSAVKTTARQSCLEVVGHNNPTGPAVINGRLSHLRAELVRDRLGSALRGLDKSPVARVGSRETVVETG